MAADRVSLRLPTALKHSLLFALLPLATLAAAADHPTPATTDLKLVWEDNFDGNTLDLSKWNYRQLGKRESAMIAKECISLDGQGHLLMTVFEKDGVLQNPMIGTQGKFSQTFGKFAARIKFPEMQGQHGAFWMQPQNKSTAVDNPAESGCEIDIVEWFGAWRKDSGIASNVYWPGPSGTKAHRVGKPYDPGIKPGTLVSDDFHVYAVEWDESGYIFSVDDHETYRISEGISKVPQYLILSLLTADWEKDRLDRTKLPNSMIVDWVRVWKK